MCWSILIVWHLLSDNWWLLSRWVSQLWGVWDWGEIPRHTLAAGWGTTPLLYRWLLMVPALSCCSLGHTGTWSAAHSGSSSRKAGTRRGPCSQSEESFRARWSQGRDSKLLIRDYMFEVSNIEQTNLLYTKELVLSSCQSSTESCCSP